MDALDVIPSLATRTGGTAINVVESALALEALGVNSVVFATDAVAAASATDRRRAGLKDLPALAENLDVRLFPVVPPRRFSFSPALHRALRNLESRDLIRIHSLFLFPQWTAYRYALETGTPYLVTFHGALDPWLRRRGRLRKRTVDALWQTDMLERAAAIHVTTEEEREATADVAPKVPRFVIPNGITTSDFRDLPDPAAFRRSALGGFDGQLISYLGRISRKKAIDVLLRAFAVLTDEFPDTLLAIIGPDDEGLRPQLERLARELGIAPRVRFTGPAYGPDRLAALAATDIWVLPSHTENFGVAVIEAMAAGLPVVISKEVNIARAAREAAAALICDVDPGDVAHQLRILLTSPAHVARLSENGRAFAARYEWSEVAPQMLAAYEFVASRIGVTR